MHKRDLLTNSKSEDLELFKYSSENCDDLVFSEKDQRFPERLTKEYVKSLPVISFKGRIHLIEKRKDLEKAIKILSQEKVLGFDTETRPNFKKGQKNSVSLLQLSTSNDAYLIRLNLLGLPYELVSLLKNKNILKVGVAILDDIRALQKLCKFDPGGFIELSNIGNQLGIVTCGLQNLAAIFFGVRITKKERLTNWDRPEFNYSQSLYAATDAWICLKMYILLKKEKLLPEKIIWSMPNPKLPKKKVFFKKNKSM